MSSSKKPPILGVSEIVLSVRDIPIMQKFYQEQLGFAFHHSGSFETETNDPQGEPTISFLTMFEVDTPLGQNGHPQFLVLIDFNRHIWAKSRFDGHNVRSSTLNHLAFEIPSDSYDDHLAKLKSNGLNPSETTFPAMGAKAIFFQDPEGNTLELICKTQEA